MCGEIVGGVEGGVGWRVEGEFGGVIGDGVFGVVGSGGVFDVVWVKSVMVVRGVGVVVLELVGVGVESDVV